MLKRLVFSGMILAACCFQNSLTAHCQMPCGIYHDDMVFDQIDQYVETMVKGISVLSESKFQTLQERNECIRWIYQKENSSNETAHLICSYFLQQKIKPNEEDTTKRVLSAHKLLFLLVQIKQTADLKILNEFYEEWERFKLFFHIEGYECKMEQIKLKKWAEKNKAAAQQLNDALDNHIHDHSHDDDHAHDHDHDDHTHDHDHTH